MIKTRKEFLHKFMEVGHIESMERADQLAQILIALIKEEIGEDLSHRIADTVPEDLGKGWALSSLEIAQKEFSGTVTPEEHAKIQKLHEKEFNAHVTPEEHARVKQVLKKDFG